MREVVAALHAWVSPGGSLYEILTTTGSLVHVEEGTNASGEPWRLAAAHAGTAASGTEAHVVFSGECLYKLPIGYDATRPGGILWGTTPQRLTLDEWAATLNDQYRHMVAHLYKCTADDDLRGMAYRPEDGTVRVGADHRVPEGGALARGEIPYAWVDVVAILCTLGGGGRRDESTGPLHTAHFGVPGATGGQKTTASAELAEYARTPTLWLVGAHAHPTADRASSPYVDVGHKAALRVDTHLHAPSFAVAVATDCDDLAHDLSRAVREHWAPPDGGGGGGGGGLPDFVSSPDAVARLATDPLFPPDAWASLVVGPVVQHVGVNGARTRARVLLWRNNRLRPDDCTCVFVNPSLVDALPCRIAPTDFPLHTILAGVLVVPFAGGETDGMGERVRLGNDGGGDKGAAAKLAPAIEARTTDIDVSDSSALARSLVHTTVVDYDDDFRTKAACMGYCVPSSDRHTGLQLGVRFTAAEEGWSLVCGWE